MYVVISYDVNTKTKEGRRRLRRIGKQCKDFGQRVQFSVFECDLPDFQWPVVKSKLLDIIKPEEDSLRFYFLGEAHETRIEHHGAKEPTDMEGPLIV